MAKLIIILSFFFQLCPATYDNMSRFNSWVARARVKFFLPKETQQQPGIEPMHQTWNPTITRLVPCQLSYCCPLNSMKPVVCILKGHHLVQDNTPFPLAFKYLTEHIAMTLQYANNWLYTEISKINKP